MIDETKKKKAKKIIQIQKEKGKKYIYSTIFKILKEDINNFLKEGFNFSEIANILNEELNLNNDNNIKYTNLRTWYYRHNKKNRKY
jgi:hypothetical protein